MSIRAKLFMVVLMCALNAGNAATNDWFAQGVEYVRDGDFPGAAAAFKNAAENQPAAGTFVNEGLAEWNRGHAGPAILAWEQARWIDPFDTRAGTNLRFARQVAEVESPQLKWYESASTWLPPNAWVWIAGASQQAARQLAGFGPERAQLLRVGGSLGLLRRRAVALPLQQGVV